MKKQDKTENKRHRVQSIEEIDTHDDDQVIALEIWLGSSKCITVRWRKPNRYLYLVQTNQYFDMVVVSEGFDNCYSTISGGFDILAIISLFWIFIIWVFPVLYRSRLIVLHYTIPTSCSGLVVLFHGTIIKYRHNVCYLLVLELESNPGWFCHVPSTR